MQNDSRIKLRHKSAKAKSQDRPVLISFLVGILISVFFSGLFFLCNAYFVSNDEKYLSKVNILNERIFVDESHSLVSSMATENDIKNIKKLGFHIQNKSRRKQVLEDYRLALTMFKIQNSPLASLGAGGETIPVGVNYSKMKQLVTMSEDEHLRTLQPEFFNSYIQPMQHIIDLSISAQKLHTQYNNLFTQDGELKATVTLGQLKKLQGEMKNLTIFSRINADQDKMVQIINAVGNDDSTFGERWYPQSEHSKRI